MVVARIHEQIAAYNRRLQSLREHPNSWWWESVQHFQQHWDPAAPDLPAMFDACFQNSVTRRLWQSEHWRPKDIMRLFWQFQPLMVKAMFEDLFNETKEVEHRITRFLFGMDTLLADYKREHPTSIENNHYHDDYRMIALYLSFRYPESYAAPYDFPLFVETLSRLGARELPQANDLVRFFKVHRTLMTFLEKDGATTALMKKHLDTRKHFSGKNLMLAVDFSRFVAEGKAI